MNAGNEVNYECDVLIVGAGIVGLAHAAEAVSRGLSVLVIDRDGHAAGASVRNFGHCCVTAQSGDLLDLARTAREDWLRHSEVAGFFAVESGGLAVARSRAEMAVLEELASVRGGGEVRLIPAADVNALLSGSADPAIAGGAVLREDIRIDPREAVGRLAAWLGQQPRVRFRWHTAYHGQLDGVARTSRGLVKAQRTIVCVGHDLDHLYPGLAERHEIQRCGLQMALVSSAAAGRILPAVLTGTSMLRYPAFAGTEAATALRAEMERTSPELLEIDANLMFTQRPDGSLLIGDSHHNGATLDPFLDEGITDTLLGHAARVLGISDFRVMQRWQGIYAASPLQPYVIAEAAENVTAVSITSGIGMTISFGLAKKVFDRLPAPTISTPVPQPTR